MLIVDISDFTKNASKIIEATSVEDVIIKNSDGNSYKLSPINNNTHMSIKDIPYITANITTQGIVDLIRENRAGI